eukprot:451384-Pelagomonas_calceolata.AAC.1
MGTAAGVRNDKVSGQQQKNGHKNCSCITLSYLRRLAAALVHVCMGLGNELGRRQQLALADCTASISIHQRLVDEEEKHDKQKQTRGSEKKKLVG